MPEIEDFKQVEKLLEEGYKLHYDKRNDQYKVYDPRVKRHVATISRSLTPAVRALLGSKSSERPPPPPPPLGPPRPSRQELLQAFEDDVQAMITMLKSRLDPKLPLMAKFVEDISWWQHLMLDFSKRAVPEVFSLMSAEDIDVRNPEATAEKMVSKLKAMREMATKAGEAEARIKAIEEEYKAKLSALEDALKKYKEVIDEQGKIIDDLATKTKKTISYILYTLPLYLTEEDRPLYYMIVNKIKEIWCPEGLAKAEQGRASPTIPSTR